MRQWDELFAVLTCAVHIAVLNMPILLKSRLSLLCREPAVVAAFSSVAKHEDAIGGTVKITAFDDVPSSGDQTASVALPPGSCNLVAFPAGGSAAPVLQHRTGPGCPVVQGSLSSTFVGHPPLAATGGVEP